jgi:hypothetical protein
VWKLSEIRIKPADFSAIIPIIQAENPYSIIALYTFIFF